MANTFEPENAVEVQGLTKIYAASGRNAPVTALDAIDLAVPRGALFGLLGPNGAGKSTLINILAGLTNKTSGAVRIWGYDIDTDTRATRSAIGVVPQELNIEPFFTPRENLELLAGFYGIRKPQRRTREVLEMVGLTEQSEAYARTLSGGMRRRLLVAKAMLHSPPVLVLDEPTAGVDVELRRNIWECLKELNAAGTTILLTTHYLEEAEKLCDRIAIINHGRVVICDTTGALVRRVDSKELVVTVADDVDAVPAPLRRFDVELLPPRRLVFRFRRSETRIGEIIDALHDLGLIIADLSTEEGSLEDIFLQLIHAPSEPGEGD
ncbi:MAG: ABC transporter ATP-binding protein [Alphaproteobacteria bacterium]|nr:ABC transporter ATP-binding protein [Alphaproteobacteria bacterium]